jgi:hypothetical protein
MIVNMVTKVAHPVGNRSEPLVIPMAGPPTCEARRVRRRCVEAVRLHWCRQCGLQFAVCRSCDRGQEHCTRRCAALTRRVQLVEIRRRYRRSAAAREAHRDQEHRRRQRQRQATPPPPTPRDSVGDQPSLTGAAPATLDNGSRTAVSVESEYSHSDPRAEAAPFRCAHCSKTTRVVVIGAWEPRWRRSRRGST